MSKCSNQSIYFFNYDDGKITNFCDLHLRCLETGGVLKRLHKQCVNVLYSEKINLYNYVVNRCVCLNEYREDVVAGGKIQN